MTKSKLRIPRKLKKSAKKHYFLDRTKRGRLLVTIGTCTDAKYCISPIILFSML